MATNLGSFSAVFRRATSALAALSVIASAHVALGQTTGADRIATGNGEGADLHMFRPAIDSRGFFSLNGASVLPANAISFGFVIDYGRNLMELSPNHGSDYLVNHAIQGTLS